MSSHDDAGRPAHRTKLTTHDVRLILFLIIRTRPFKYVGDRGLSQTKKWRLIQQQYADIKAADLGPSSTAAEIVVPTVRTLQRQLATAIKKARFRLPPETPLPETPEQVTAVSRESLLNDLELALYELHHLSDRLKAGKGSAPTPELAPVDGTPAPLATPSLSAAPGAAEAAAAARLALQHASDTRMALANELHHGASFDTLVGLLTTLIHQNNDYARELERLVDAAVAFVSRQTDLLREMIAAEAAARTEHADQNRLVILDVLERLDDRLGPAEPPAQDSSKTHLLKSLQELLN